MPTTDPSPIAVGSGSPRRYAVILGEGRYVDERAGAATEAGVAPRKDFLAIADLLDADIHSYMTGTRRLGALFARVFRGRRAWGSALNAALLAPRYDAMFVTGEDVGTKIALWARLLGRRCRMVCIVHRWTPGFDRLLRIAGHRAFATMIVVSEAQRALLIASGVPAAKIRHSFDGFDDLFYRPPSAGADDESDGTLVVACGAENRDYDLLAQAVEGLPWRLKIFGAGYWAASLQYRPRRLSDNVEMMPRVTYEELRATMGRAAVLAVPLHAANFAAGVNGLMEALAVGRPVVVTDSPGITEYLGCIPPENRIAPGDVAGFRAAIARVLAQPDRYQEAAMSAADWVAQACGFNGYVKRIADIVTEVKAS